MPCVVRSAASSSGAGPNYSDPATQAAALRAVNDLLAPAVALQGPLPATRDIQSALRLLLDRVHLPAARDDGTFDGDRIQDLRDLGCPYEVPRAALRGPCTSHSWPALLSVLHWLTLLVSYSSQAEASSSAAGGGLYYPLLLHIAQGYCSYLSGHRGEASAAAVPAPGKEARQPEAEVKKLASGPSRRQALESEKAAVIADAQKFEAVVETWKTKVNEGEQALGDLEKELEAKVSDAKATAAENGDLLGQVRDVQRIHREMQVVEDDIESTGERLAQEDKDLELDTKLVTKLEDLERLAEQCNQALKRLEPGIAFQYMINAKGSSPAEMLGTGYKRVLKPGLVAHAKKSKMIHFSNLEDLNDLQKQMQGNDKVLEEERNRISSLQAANDKMVARLNSLDHEMTNDDSIFTSDARQMNDDLEKKKNSLISVEMQADDFLKISEKRLQDARLKADKETQAAANELQELVDSMAEHKEFIETIIAKKKKDLHEAEDYVASSASR